MFRCPLDRGAGPTKQTKLNGQSLFLPVQTNPLKFWTYQKTLEKQTGIQAPSQIVFSPNKQTMGGVV